MFSKRAIFERFYFYNVLNKWNDKLFLPFQTNVKYELATAQVPQGQQQQNVKYVLANQSGAGQAANVVNVVTSRYHQINFKIIFAKDIIISNETSI